MSENNLTYLMGAGASANALPVVSQLYDRMEYFLKNIERNDNLPRWLRNQVENHEKTADYFEGPRSETDIDEVAKHFESMLKNFEGKEIRQKLIQKGSELIGEARRHESIDVYAKKLYLLNESKKYVECKAFISLFLIFEQLGLKEDYNCRSIFLNVKEDKINPDLKSKAEENLTSFKSDLDKRYDQFFAAFLKENTDKENCPILPNNLNILSWNYDLQLELALKRFSKFNLLSEARDFHKLFPRGPKFEPSHDVEKDSKILKINGSCGMVADCSGWYYTETNLPSLAFGFLNLVKLFLEPEENSGFNTEPAISFAWENGDNVAKWDFTSNMIRKSSSIVIIGYSFPVFNREIDKKLFSKLSEDTKIYIQDLPHNLQSVTHAAKSIIPEGNSIEPIQIDKVDQFYVPFEFVPEYPE